MASRWLETSKTGIGDQAYGIWNRVPAKPVMALAVFRSTSRQNGIPTRLPALELCARSRQLWVPNQARARFPPSPAQSPQSCIGSRLLGLLLNREPSALARNSERSTKM